MKRFLCLLLSCLLLTSCTAGNSRDDSSDFSGSQSSSAEESAEEEKMEMLIGKNTYAVDFYNPTADAEGISVFDKASGLLVSETGEGYADILVFDNTVADIRVGKSSFMPFPNGFLIRMPASEADKVSVGDSVSVFGFGVEVNPKEYVLIKERIKIPVFYKNESRTAVARAVIYDGDYIHDSTDTNIWGMEMAVDSSGAITEIVQLGIEGVSGNTPIPDGGFVLSTGNSMYCTFLGSAKVGDSARYIKEFGLYDFYSVNDLLNDYGEGEYLSKITDSVTKLNENALEFIVSADGTVTSVSTGGGKIVPDGGFALVATGVKRNELLRFCAVGKKVFDKNGVLYIYTDGSYNIDLMRNTLDELKASAENAAKMLYTMDYSAIDGLIEAAEEAMLGGKYENLTEIITELTQKITPQFAVQERGAWVTDYDSDPEDVKKTVAYAKSIGLNTLFVSPFRDTYALYDTDMPHLCKHKDFDFDLLQAYVDECHKQGISLIFDICTFTTVKPSDKYESDHYVNYFADRLLLSKQGRDVAYFYSTPSYTLNPYDAEVRQWYIDLIKEVCLKYDIDGVQLDYIRFPLPTYYSESNYEDFGYNEDIIAAFMKKEKTSVAPADCSPSGELWEKWCSFRCDIITSFVVELKNAIGDMPLSCTCFASETDRQKYVFQDVAAWTDHIDAIYPMIYATTLEDQQKYGDEMYSIIGESCRIVLGIGTYDGETDDVVTKQHLYSTSFADGNAIFALNYTQAFGFDKTYKRIFGYPAVRSDLEGVTASAYLGWIAHTAECVYEYLYDCDLSDVKKELTDAASLLEPLSGSEFAAEASRVLNSLSSLAQKLPDEVKADYLSKLDYLSRLINR